MVWADGENFLIRTSSFGQKRSRLVQCAIFPPQKLLLNNDIFLVENCVYTVSLWFSPKYRRF